MGALRACGGERRALRALCGCSLAFCLSPPHPSLTGEQAKTGGTRENQLIWRRTLPAMKPLCAELSVGRHDAESQKFVDEVL